MRKIILALIILLFCQTAYADQYTTNYRFGIPSSASRDWLAIISNDIISMDILFKQLSDDINGAWTKVGTSIYNTTTTDFVGIGTNAPVAELDIRGALTCDTISVDTIRFTRRHIYPDRPTTMLTMFVSADSLVWFYDGTNYHLVTTTTPGV